MVSELFTSSALACAVLNSGEIGVREELVVLVVLTTSLVMESLVMEMFWADLEASVGLSGEPRVGSEQVKPSGQVKPVR